MKNYRRLLIVGVILGIFVVGLGAFTRLTEAGLGCPDWPGCYGFLTVPSSAEQIEHANALYPAVPVEAHKAWYEMIHRYFAGSLGLVILALFVMAWRQRLPLILPFALCVTVVFQALLGMWTVTMNLNPLIVMGHLLGGFVTVSLLWWQWLRVGSQASSVNQLHQSEYATGAKHSLRSLRWLGLTAMSVLMFQIALGGWTSTNYAAMVCTQLPLCEVDWVAGYDLSAFELLQPAHDTYQFGVLNFEQRVTIHVTHRIGALVTTLILGVYLFKLARFGVAMRYWLIPLAALCSQVGLGINNIVSILPLSNAVAHNVMGLMLLLSMLLSVQPLLSPRSVFRLQGGQYGKV